MSGSGNATVSVIGAALWLRNWYLTVTVSGLIVSSSDSIAMSGERVKTSPPTDNSAEESLARLGEATAQQPAAIAKREWRNRRLLMPSSLGRGSTLPNEMTASNAAAPCRWLANGSYRFGLT